VTLFLSCLWHFVERWVLMRLRMRPAVLAAGLVLAGMTTHAWMNERMLAQAQRMGPPAAARAQVLAQEIVEAQGLDEIARLKGVNAFFNRAIVFREDKDVWGQVDYWASPLEMMNRGQGDCEDFAIAKYFALMAAGVPSAKLRLVYVRAQIGAVTQAHMVLAYYRDPMAEPLILDSLLGDIRPASRRPDLSPVFSFNAEGLWQGVGASRAGDPSARLSRWRDMLTKAKAEGWW
jgi:predicted transglutaminase-like cysteine proteinase